MRDVALRPPKPSLDVAAALPRMRGVVHAWAALPALAAAVVLVCVAPAGEARAASAVYGLGLVALFAGSALYHRWPPGGRGKARLRRVDHATIFVFIAGSYTPAAVLVLTGDTRVAVLASVWLGAAAGVTMSVAWIDAPRWLQAACYLGLGWVAVLVLPQLFAGAGVAAGSLFLIGGVLYSAGAVVYARQRPDPWPQTFGFHEVFHTLVTVAAIVQYVAIAIVVLA